MGKKNNHKYRPEEAQQLLDEAEESFERAGSLAFREPEEALSMLRTSITSMAQYGEMVNRLRANDGREPLNHADLCTHFKRRTQIKDFEHIANTIKESMSGEREQRRQIYRAPQ